MHPRIEFCTNYAQANKMPFTPSAIKSSCPSCACPFIKAGRHYIVGGASPVITAWLSIIAHTPRRRFFRHSPPWQTTFEEESLQQQTTGYSFFRETCTRAKCSACCGCMPHAIIQHRTYSKPPYLESIDVQFLQLQGNSVGVAVLDPS